MKKLLLIVLAAFFASACGRANAERAHMKTPAIASTFVEIENLEKTDLSGFRGVCSLLAAYHQVEQFSTTRLAEARVDPKRFEREKERRAQALREGLVLHFQRESPVPVACSNEDRALLSLVRDKNGFGLPRAVMIDFLRLQAAGHVQDLHSSSWDRQQRARLFFRYNARVLKLTREELEHIGLSSADAEQTGITSFEGIPTS